MTTIDIEKAVAMIMDEELSASCMKKTIAILRQLAEEQPDEKTHSDGAICSICGIGCAGHHTDECAAVMAGQLVSMILLTRIPAETHKDELVELAHKLEDTLTTRPPPTHDTSSRGKGSGR